MPRPLGKAFTKYIEQGLYLDNMRQSAVQTRLGPRNVASLMAKFPPFVSMVSVPKQTALFGLHSGVSCTKTLTLRVHQKIDFPSFIRGSLLRSIKCAEEK